MNLNRLAIYVKTGLVLLISTALLTYCSLLVPGNVIAVCSEVGTPVSCPVLAYGFPLPFIADSQAVSPVGSVARDPLSLFIGLDDILWPELAISGFFWFDAIVICRLIWLWVSKNL